MNCYLIEVTSAITEDGVSWEDLPALPTEQTYWHVEGSDPWSVKEEILNVLSVRFEHRVPIHADVLDWIDD